VTIATKIGFIGVGMMGQGMAKNLVEKGFATTILGNRNRVPVDRLLALGAAEGRDGADVAAKSDIVFICVTGSPQVEAVVYGARGLLAGAREGLIVVDCSTSEPDSSDRIRADFAKAGVAFVDAPLARTPKEAEAGKLNVMVGADPAIFDAIRPALAAFAENIVHVGAPGAGHKTKLIYNFIAMGHAAIIAEAMTACVRSGVDPGNFVKVVTAGGANSGIFQMIVPKALERDFTGLQFGIALAQKDLRYYTHLTESLNLPSLVGEAVHQSFVQAAALGFGTSFVPSLIEAQEKITGVRIGKT
jgi:3-hydroxyisobutyrate dehydrogenase-like beta-hydroxyacid dehydrogenase